MVGLPNLDWALLNLRSFFDIYFAAHLGILIFQRFNCFIFFFVSLFNKISEDPILLSSIVKGARRWNFVVRPFVVNAEGALVIAIQILNINLIWRIIGFVLSKCL